MADAEPRPLHGGRRGGLDRGGWRGGDGADGEALRPPLRKHAARDLDGWDEAGSGGGNDGMDEPCPLLPSAPARDRSSHSPAPSAPAKKAAVAVDRGTRQPSPSATLPPPKCHISMEPLVGEQAKQNRSRTESRQERCPTSGGETLPPNIQQTDVTSTPNLSQFLSSSGLKRKRTPVPTGMTEAGRAEQTFANENRVNENLTAGLDGEMGDGWSEHGFRRFVSSLNPVFKMVSRRIITRDFTNQYQEERQVLVDFFKNVKGRVSLTMDMWTSNQTLGYLCITGHFTDDDWKMHKRILKFSFMKTPHTGVAMFNVVLKFLQEWNIENKLFAITLDNASNNNAMMKLLKANLLEKKMVLGKGKLVHQRCAAHVQNLICKAGFQIINPIVHKIRESVKYIEGSPSRKQKFEEIIQQLYSSADHSPKLPKIDTCTRWNSTYLMLKNSLELKRAFESLGQQDPEYTFEPTPEEWEKARKVCELLKVFFDATKVVSRSLYPTANLHFHEIWEIRLTLENQVPEAEADPELAEVIQYMQRKFRRYWKLTWLQVSFPVIFDPRFKLKFIDFRLKQAFGSEAESKIGIVKNTLLELFKDYSAGQETTQAHCVVQTSTSGRYADWDDHVNLDTQLTNEVPSELEAYLSKQAIPRSEEFDILGWWKNNALEYPTLSRMARDVLVAPASSVPSEQAFSLAKRLISDFRSRLSPKTVEELMCLQDWFRSSRSTKFSMESMDLVNISEEEREGGWI